MARASTSSAVKDEVAKVAAGLREFSTEELVGALGLTAQGSPVVTKEVLNAAIQMRLAELAAEEARGARGWATVSAVAACISAAAAVIQAFA